MSAERMPHKLSLKFKLDERFKSFQFNSKGYSFKDRVESTTAIFVGQSKFLTSGKDILLKNSTDNEEYQTDLYELYFSENPKITNPEDHCDIDSAGTLTLDGHILSCNMYAKKEIVEYLISHDLGQETYLQIDLEEIGSDVENIDMSEYEYSSPITVLVKGYSACFHVISFKIFSERNAYAKSILEENENLENIADLSLEDVKNSDVKKFRSTVELYLKILCWLCIGLFIKSMF